MAKFTYYIGITFSKFEVLLVFIMYTVLSQHSFGQQIAAKKPLKQADYSLWHDLELEGISDDGNWVSYSHIYADTDTLFVHNRNTKTILSFAGGTGGVFKKNFYVCKTADERLHIVSLKKGSEKVLEQVQHFKAYDHFIVAEQQLNNEIVTVLVNYDGKELHRERHVFEYQVSPNEKYISLLKREGSMNAFSVLTIKGFVPTEHLKRPISEGLFSLMAWSSGSGAVAFFDTSDAGTTIQYYNFANRILERFTTSFEGFPASMNIYVPAELNLSPDGNRVFFKIRQKSELNVSRPSNAVQVWNASDPQIYPSSIITEDFTQNPRLVMWAPAAKRFLEITNDTYPVGGTGGNSTVALVYNPLTHSAADKFTTDADIYVNDLSGRTPKLMAKNVIGGSTNAVLSPTGRYVSYFSKGDWMVYAVATGQTTNLTKNVPFSFSMESLTEEGENGYGNPGWSAHDAYLLLYDAYDLWKIKPDGTFAERLTRGREHGIKYRLIGQKKKGQSKTNDGRITTLGAFDLQSNLLFKTGSIAQDYNGFSEWHPNSTLHTICYVPKAISGIVQSENDTYMWTEEDVAQPRALMVRKDSGMISELHASNKQQQFYNWTKKEVLHYHNSEGVPLKGILYYPAGYVVGELYPMVVHIYQKQSHLLYNYTLPTLANSDGFNITNLTSKGYFVLLPDITYTAGAIGSSAVDCVEAGVREALENTSIDIENLGLIGHSFGGTQTAFIITQSSLFKCAIAGAATTDFISSHLSVTPNYKIPNFYKIERAQARMMVSPFEDWERYLKNSALYYAANITTPLLSWTGLKDGQVDYTQSFEFYLALRRLKKEHTMLVYPDVEHDMSGRAEALDLTQKMEDWLDYYLKSSAKPNWL